MISKQSIAKILLNEITERERENEVGNIRCLKRFESLNRIELEQELYKANCKIEILEGLLRISDERYRKERQLRLEENKIYTDKDGLKKLEMYNSLEGNHIVTFTMNKDTHSKLMTQIKEATIKHDSTP